MSDMPVIPIPTRGWTPVAMVRFLEHLSVKGNVRAACARVGLSAEAAYRLRRRDGRFARGWAAAMVLARDNSEQIIATRAIEGVEEPVFYRGEQIGTRRRYDTRLLLAHMARLDRLAAQPGAAGDAWRFDELLAGMAGEDAPDDLLGADAFLPAGREEHARRMEIGVDDDLLYPDVEVRSEDIALDEQILACEAVRAQARADARAAWDDWYADACAAVDRVLDEPPPAPPASATPCVILPEVQPALALPNEDEGGDGCGEHGRETSPRTVSTVSTSVLASRLTGPPQGFALAPHAAFNGRKRGRPG